MAEYTTVRVSREFHDELARMGSKSETFEQVIRRLLETAGAKK